MESASGSIPEVSEHAQIGSSGESMASHSKAHHLSKPASMAQLFMDEQTALKATGVSQASNKNDKAKGKDTNKKSEQQEKKANKSND